MRLTFIYQPVVDLQEAAAFHRDQLGLDEAWREADDTIAFSLPDQSVELMVSTTPQPAGPMYLVESLDAWISAHPDVPTAVDKFEIPGGAVAGFASPGGNIFYVFDQPALS